VPGGKRHRRSLDAGAMDALPGLTPEQASSYARLALANVEREYPCKLDHVSCDVSGVASPRALHPAFFGSFDWHSCVHAHWLLATVHALHPGLPEAGAIRAAFDAHLAPANIAGEIAYLSRPASRGFERTYGWAWLLKLAQMLSRSEDADAQRWSCNLAPLAQAFAARFRSHLPDATYPIRHGVHSNSAFGLAFALDYARTCGAGDLAELCVAKARGWYLQDVQAPAMWEPSGADFLSPTLIEADLMRRILDGESFAAWLHRFLPDLEQRQPAPLFTPAMVSDRSDLYIVHLDGLNLSRAWCWRAIAAALPPNDPRVRIAVDAAREHLQAGLAGVDTGDYAGDHWLATFAAVALTT
jgi:hypothetical protein